MIKICYRSVAVYDSRVGVVIRRCIKPCHVVCHMTHQPYINRFSVHRTIVLTQYNNSWYLPNTSTRNRYCQGPAWIGLYFCFVSSRSNLLSMCRRLISDAVFTGFRRLHVKNAQLRNSYESIDCISSRSLSQFLQLLPKRIWNY